MPSRKQQGRVARWAANVGIAPLLLVAGAVAPCPAKGAAHVAGLPDLCPTHHFLGVPCPGCGMTRALICCCHGEFVQAVAFHPLGPVLFMWLVFTAVRRFPWICDRLPSLPLRVANVLWGLPLVVTMGIWAARLLHYLPPP